MDATVKFDKLSNNIAITKSVSKNFSEVTIPAYIKFKNITYKTRILGPNAFSGLQAKKVVFPSSLKLIGFGCFSNSYIEEITLPDSLTAIDPYAFCNCTHLMYVNMSNLWIDELPEGCFMNCYHLETILLPRAETICQKALQSTSIRNDGFAIPRTVLSIQEYAFFNISNFFSLDLSITEITLIGSYAFASCYNLSSIILPPNLATIYSNVIENTNITSITIPSSIKTIGKNAFLNKKLERIYSESESFTVFNNTLFYTPPGRANKSQLYFVPPATDATVYRVKRSTEEIMRFAFAKSQIHTMIIPLSVRIIHKYAFYDSNISLLQFQHSRTGMTLEFIEEGAFYKCQQLTNIDFSFIDIIQIPDACFSKCTRLESFTFPHKLQFIGAEAFSYTGLKAITIPSEVMTIVPGAFSNCLSLRNISVAKGNIAYEVHRGILYDYVNSSLLVYPPTFKKRHLNLRPKTLRISAYAFSNARLETISINNEVRRIGSYAFQHSNLRSICLPESVRFLGTGVFSNCTFLKAADMDNATVSIMPDLAFDGCTSLQSVLLPFALIEFKSNCFRGCVSLSVVYYDGTTSIGGTNIFPNNTKVYVTDSYPPNTFLGLPTNIDYKLL